MSQVVVVSPKDLIGDMLAMLERSRRLIRVVDGYAELLDETTGTYWYEIDLDRLKNETDLVGWINHLLGKNWITKGHLTALCDLAESRGIHTRIF